jgi:hypothetical protein
MNTATETMMHDKAGDVMWFDNHRDVIQSIIDNHMNEQLYTLITEFGLMAINGNDYCLRQLQQMIDESSTLEA